MMQSSEQLTLRQWMQAEFGGLREDRSTESYALEFLRTAQANLKLAQEKARLAHAAGQLTYFAGWVRELLEKLPKQIEQIEKLSKQQE